MSSIRRSARAPTTQAGAGTRQDTHSSASSISSSRVERSSRVNQKLSPPQGSSTPRSQSPADGENTTNATLRRTRSSHDEIKIATNQTEKVSINELAADDEDEEEEDEEEETRCVCGQLEYPGLPVTSGNSAKARTQVDSDPVSEDSTGWFIQCDECQVWQHGGCVGILNENGSPEKYFCEQCRKDLHHINKDLNGRRYSIYRPVQQKHSPSPSPIPKGRETSKRTRESRASRTELENLAKGRRATMNSRDSAYDEAEQLRRAIEESKRESLPRNPSARKGKRERSESEERDEDAKRRRTASGSSSTHSKQNRQEEVSGDEDAQKADKHKNMRGAAARNHRAKELRDREAREKERGETGRRKAQSSRRKADEPGDPIEPTRAAASKGGTAAKGALAGKSHKKGGRPPARKGRLGRNQYTKDRDPPNNILSPRSNNSRDGEHALSQAGNGVGEINGLGKPSRPRHMNPNRTTLNDMKRRVAGILEFISHTQVEMAGLDSAKSRASSAKSSSTNLAVTGVEQQNAGDGLKSKSDVLNTLGESESVNEDAFGKLNAVDMMEVLTRRLMRWQSQYGKYGEK